MGLKVNCIKDTPSALKTERTHQCFNFSLTYSRTDDVFSIGNNILAIKLPSPAYTKTTNKQTNIYRLSDILLEFSIGSYNL